MGVSYLLLGFNLLLSGRSQQQVVWLLGPRFSPSTGCLAWPLSLMGSLTASGGCYSNKQFFCKSLHVLFRSPLVGTNFLPGLHFSSTGTQGSGCCVWTVFHFQPGSQSSHDQ